MEIALNNEMQPLKGTISRKEAAEIIYGFFGVNLENISKDGRPNPIERLALFIVNAFLYEEKIPVERLLSAIDNGISENQRGTLVKFDKRENGMRVHIGDKRSLIFDKRGEDTNLVIDFKE